MAKSIEYYEGDEEHEIVALLKNAQILSSCVNIAPEKYSSWPIRYHLTSTRGNLVRPFNFSGLEVLEVGAGMGAISRAIAESAKHLTIIEGTSLRYEGACARLRDLSNWDGAVSNIQDFTSDRKYDVVCMVGVLEYSELYIDKPDPFLWVLRHLKSFLKSGGVLLLAIENKNGLKYFAGATEDHTGRHFDGICGYKAEKSVRTFSYAEMQQLLAAAGFSCVSPYFPCPDYKIPNAVLSGDLLTRYPQLSGQLIANYPSEDCNGQHRRLFSEALVWQNLASAGLLAEMANSFLFVATDNADSPTLSKLKRGQYKKQLAHCYSMYRVNPVQTVFVEDEGKVFVGKSQLDGAAQDGEFTELSPVYDGEWYVLHVMRNMCFEGKDSTLNELSLFVSHIFSLFSSKIDNGLLPKAIDALPHNVIKNSDGYKFFDLEFESEIPLSKSWYILRVIFISESNYSVFSMYDSEFSCKKYYEELCTRCAVIPDYIKDIECENKFQAIVSGRFGYVIAAEREPYFFDVIKKKIKSRLRKLFRII